MFAPHESSAADVTVGKIQKDRGQRVAKMYDQQKRNIIHTSSTAYEQDHSAAAPPSGVRRSAWRHARAAELPKGGLGDSLRFDDAIGGKLLPEVDLLADGRHELLGRSTRRSNAVVRELSAVSWSVNDWLAALLILSTI